MPSNLSNELLQLQKSRCGYSEMVDNYMRDMPSKVGKTLNRPLDSINKNVSIVNHYRGKMLLNLERRFYIAWRKLKRYTKT